jgi:hypothetical protein
MWRCGSSPAVPGAVSRPNANVARGPTRLCRASLPAGELQGGPASGLGRVQTGSASGRHPTIRRHPAAFLLPGARVGIIHSSPLQPVHWGSTGAFKATSANIPACCKPVLSGCLTARLAISWRVRSRSWIRDIWLSLESWEQPRGEGEKGLHCVQPRLSRRESGAFSGIGRARLTIGCEAAGESWGQ